LDSWLTPVAVDSSAVAISSSVNHLLDELYNGILALGFGNSPKDFL
jgi:hypothetical protein